MNRASTLRAEEIHVDLARAWDELVIGRGLQADVFDTHAWASSWWASRPRRAEQVRVPAVFAGDRPLALLPLELDSTGRAHELGRGQRERTRVVIGTPEPQPAVLRPLVAELRRLGIRELTLHRMPSRDPATHALLGALREAGYAVDVRERMTDMIESTPDGWSGYRARHRGFDSAIGQTTRRARQLWPLRVAAFGAPGTPPLAAGLADHEELFGLSWKGRLGASPHRRRLLTHALDERGLARLYVLYAEDRAIASCLGVRIGPVMHWHTIAYDPAAALLSPGNVVHWRAQELAFAESGLALIDLLPGASPLKDRVSSERPALLDVCAARVPRRVLPLLRGVREVQRAVPIATRARVERLRSRVGAAASGGAGPARRLEARPATGVPARPSAELTLDEPTLRLLTVACARRGPQEMRADWGPDDRWYRIGAGPIAVARVDVGEPVPTLREVVRYDPAYTLEAIALMLADLLASPVRYLDEIPVRDPRLRWPRTWPDPESPTATKSAQEPDNSPESADPNGPEDPNGPGSADEFGGVFVPGGASALEGVRAPGGVRGPEVPNGPGSAHGFGGVSVSGGESALEGMREPGGVRGPEAPNGPESAHEFGGVFVPGGASALEGMRAPGGARGPEVPNGPGSAHGFGGVSVSGGVSALEGMRAPGGARGPEVPNGPGSAHGFGGVFVPGGVCALEGMRAPGGVPGPGDPNGPGSADEFGSVGGPGGVHRCGSGSAPGHASGSPGGGGSATGGASGDPGARGSAAGGAPPGVGEPGVGDRCVDSGGRAPGALSRIEGV